MIRQRRHWDMGCPLLANPVNSKNRYDSTLNKWIYLIVKTVISTLTGKYFLVLWFNLGGYTGVLCIPHLQVLLTFD